MHTLLFLLLLLLGDVDITPAHRVPNRSGLQCVWASLETQARHWRLTCLYDLTRTYKEPATCAQAVRVLAERGVHAYWSGAASPRDWQSLANASQRHWPMAVALRGLDYYHVVTLTDITRETVTLIDCDDPDLAVRTYSRKWFAGLWDGWFITLDPGLAEAGPQDSRSRPWPLPSSSSGPRGLR